MLLKLLIDINEFCRTYLRTFLRYTLGCLVVGLLFTVLNILHSYGDVIASEELQKYIYLSFTGLNVADIQKLAIKSLLICLFVCLGFIVPLDANYDLCSALMTIEQ